MKIRNGFVSNSSSSSFILFFKSIPQDTSDIKNLVFNKYETDNDYVFDDNSNCYPISVVSKSILESIKDNVINFDDMISKFKEEFEHIDQYNVDYLDEFFDGHKYSDEYEILKNEVLLSNNTLENRISELYRQLHKKPEKEEEEKIRIEIRELYNKKYNKQEEISEKVFEFLKEILREKYENYNFSYVEYSDNDGDFCAFMEHGGLLDRISLVRISHH